MRLSAARIPSQRRTPGLPVERHEVVCAPSAPARTLTGGLTELVWVGGHVLMYPLGTQSEELRPDPRIRPGEQPPGVRALFAADPLAADASRCRPRARARRQPVGVRRHATRPPQARLQPGLSLELRPALGDVAGATDLGARIEQICEQTGTTACTSSATASAGLIARYYVQRQGGDRRVGFADDPRDAAQGVTSSRTCSPTSGSVHSGLPPGSPVLRELEEPAAGCTTRLTAIYSDLDQVVVPTSSAGQSDHPDLQARNLLRLAGSGTCRCRATAVC